jgi:hypothetical protein
LQTKNEIASNESPSLDEASLDAATGGWCRSGVVGECRNGNCSTLRWGGDRHGWSPYSPPAIYIRKYRRPW